MSTRVLIVDDSNLFRLGLSALISANPEFSVVGHTRSGKEVVQAALRTLPQVVLMDPIQHGLNGLEIVEHLKRRQPDCKVMLLTSGKSDEFVRQALRAGVDGIVLKDASIDELFMAMRYAVQGKKYLSPDVSTQVLQGYLHPNGDSRMARLDSLTARERSVLQLIAEGGTNRTAAEYLSVSPKTVEKHRATLMQKLGLRNAVELTLMALEMGLIERPGALALMRGGSPAGDGVAA
ncbi:MAG: response regulator transcription factor [Proteobacteria bacterium]|nr:response regulator transcription factor [Pseudomonadota bacterium]